MKKYFCFYILIIFLIAWHVFNFFVGERVTVNNGLGWDGIFIAQLTQNFGSYFHNISHYYSGRVFPSLVVSLFAKLFFYSLNSPQNIISAFYLYDMLIILLGIYFFYCVAKFQQWSFPSFLIGFTALFCNFAILKAMPYHPNLTDYTALTIGLAILYFYLRNNLIGLLATTFIGAFTFPSILLSNSLLILFPIKSAPSAKNISIPILPQFLKIKPLWLATILSGLLSVLIILYALLGPFTGENLSFAIATHYRTLLANYNQTVTLVIISAVALFIYLSALMQPFIKDRISLSTNVTRVFYIIIITYLITLIKTKYLINPNSLGGLTIWQYLRNVMLEAVSYPIIFLVAHFVYFGPPILIMIFLWRKMAEISYEIGFGLFLFTLLYGWLSIGSESRQLINALPVFVFLLCQGLDNLKISLKFAYSVLVISLIVSKFWLPLNFFAWPTKLEVFGGDALNFPQQLLFMNFGPTMAPKTYLIQLIIMLIVFCGFYRCGYFSKGAIKELAPEISTGRKVEFLPDGGHAVPSESGETMQRRPRRNHRGS
jgi:hypothetical protein